MHPAGHVPGAHTREVLGPDHVAVALKVYLIQVLGLDVGGGHNAGLLTDKVEQHARVKPVRQGTIKQSRATGTARRQGAEQVQ
jgi:hypothetical protein